jgi:hypothetical protein
METTETWILELDEVVDVDKMVSQSHLVLFLSFVEVTVKHLKDSIFSIDLTIMILLKDLYVFF